VSSTVIAAAANKGNARNADATSVELETDNARDVESRSDGRFILIMRSSRAHRRYVRSFCADGRIRALPMIENGGNAAGRIDHMAPYTPHSGDQPQSLSKITGVPTIEKTK
jgi:hypothetical protein